MTMPLEAQRIAEPFNIEVEQQLLGALLMHRAGMERVVSFLRDEHFSEPVHQRVYQLCQLLWERDRQITVMALSTLISAEQNDMWSEIGGRSYIARLAGAATGTDTITEYARDVVDLWRRRELLATIDASYGSITDMAMPFDAVTDVIEETCATLRQEGQKRLTARYVSDIAPDALNALMAAKQRQGGLNGLSTGLADLDKMVGGLAGGDMIVIAGRPSMGKSSLALFMARAVAEEGRGVCYISPEMTCQEFAFRLASIEADLGGHHIEYSAMRRGALDAEQEAHAIKAIERTKRYPLLIEEAGDISVSGIRAIVKKTARQFDRDGTPLSLIVIDHMGLIQVPKAEGRYEKLTYISGQMKALAKLFNVPVIALSQLSRQVEQRDDKRPHLADLRESGAIEQDADLVLFPYRHEYYLEREKPDFKSVTAQADWEADALKHRNICDIAIAKHRNGPIGNVKVFCDVSINAFGNISRADWK